jgi:transcriptional regulator with XRE-family HTH domain
VTPHEIVAAEVRAQLARRKLSGVRAARALGWSQNYISRRLSGTVPFDVTDLAAIAELLEVPMTTFFEVASRPQGEGSRTVLIWTPDQAAA